MSNNELSVKDFLNNQFGFNNDFSIQNAKNILDNNLSTNHLNNVTLSNPSTVSPSSVSNMFPTQLPESHLPKGIYKFDGEKLVRIGEINEN